jgi:hypothetical protein
MQLSRVYRHSNYYHTTTYPYSSQAAFVGTPLTTLTEPPTLLTADRFNNMEALNSLDLHHKSDILKQQANYLLTLEMGELSVKLYTWDRFFIEQYFDEEQRVSKISIAGRDDMIKYLKKIGQADLGYPIVV